MGFWVLLLLSPSLEFLGAGACVCFLQPTMAGQARLFPCVPLRAGGGCLAWLG